MIFFAPMAQRNKILNDPVYGFISLRHGVLLEIIDHPYFQRLRRISQLGLSHLVYPGALHNRFHHAIGAMHLMMSAIDVLKQKGHPISEEEEIGALIAILLHDIGHGPFSHALEHSMVGGISHEEISMLFMDRLNEEFDGQLDLAISIFTDSYERHFFHELVSSQLDMDRLDYLRRDSFYTGVTEGNVGSERILKMLDVVDDQLVVEEKGIYSIEKFIVARRLMYWQVYLHKTVLSAEFMMVNIVKRARDLALNGTELPCSPALRYFLYNEIAADDFNEDPETLATFAQLDDFDVMQAVKEWQFVDDKVLSKLCQMLTSRRLFKVIRHEDYLTPAQLDQEYEAIMERFDLNKEEAAYFVLPLTVDNYAYRKAADNIRIKYKDGTVQDVAEASDHLNLSALSQKVEKHFLCRPSLK